MLRLAAGEDRALNELIDRWGERVASFLLRMTGNHSVATDLAQEVFVRLYQSRDSYRPSAKFSTWLFTIASNLAKNHRRWAARHPTVSIDADEARDHGPLHEPVSRGPTPDDALVDAERNHAVRQVFLSLPPDLRETMTLFLDEDMGYAEIAATLGCTTKAVETRIYRARQLLQALDPIASASLHHNVPTCWTSCCGTVRLHIMRAMGPDRDRVQFR